MRAQYSGQCQSCDEPILRGEAIVPAHDGYGFVHLECELDE